MTLDELDAAFKADEVSTNTIVRRPGTVQWKTLADIAGIEPSAITLESESLVPVASDVALPDLPQPPPLPREARKTDGRLTTAELAIVRPKTMRRTAAGVAIVGVVGAAVFFGVSGLLSALNPPQMSAATAFVAPAHELPAPAAKLPPSAPPLLEQGSMIVFAHAPEAKAEAKPEVKPAPKAAVKIAAPAPKAPAFAARAGVAPQRVQVGASVRAPASPKPAAAPAAKKVAPRHL